MLQRGREEPAFTQLLERSPAIDGLYDAFDWSARGFDSLVTEGGHGSTAILAQSCESPDETRKISSSVVMPAAALANAS